MRLLVDESLSARVASLLTASGHDAVHIGDLGLLGAPDESVMAAAERESRVLLAADTDFGELLALGGRHLPSVILLRRGSHLPEAQAATVLANLTEVADALADGAIVVISDSSVRFRLLPINPSAGE